MGINRFGEVQVYRVSMCDHPEQQEVSHRCRNLQAEVQHLNESSSFLPWSKLNSYTRPLSSITVIKSWWYHVLYREALMGVRCEKEMSKGGPLSLLFEMKSFHWLRKKLLINIIGLYEYSSRDLPTSIWDAGEHNMSGNGKKLIINLYWWSNR